MKKIHSKLLFFAIICISFLFISHSLASTTIAEEGISFYTQTISYGYIPEGTAFYASLNQITDTLPVYRFYNSSNGDYYYTISEDDKAALETQVHGAYSYEGVAFYAFSNQITDTLPVYRFYNSNNGDHYYTISEDDKTTLETQVHGAYRYEGVAFYAYKTQTLNTLPVYRFYNNKNGKHFYTASEDDYKKIAASAKLTPVYRFYNSNNDDHYYTISEDDKAALETQVHGAYHYEGVAFYAFSNQITDTLPVYRFYNSNNGDHYYTISEDDKAALETQVHGAYHYEGVAFYAYITQVSNTLPVYRFYDYGNAKHFYTASESERSSLLAQPLGPDISVGLWYYGKADIQSNHFQIDANKSYNIKDVNGAILAQAGGTSTTSVGYDDNQNQLTVEGPLSKTLAGKAVTFDAADGDNSTLIFNTHRSNYVTSDWRGNINHYRGKIKIQYYRGYDIVNGAVAGSADVTQIWVDNILPLEQYAWGSAETSGTGNINHTEVMSTIYRTYGFWYIKYANKYTALGFKIRSDSGSQNYGGYDWETSHPNVKTATQNTRAVIATYGGDVALTPYSSWSDGRTRSWQEKWGGTDYPWCQSVPDPYGKNVALSGPSHMVGLIANGSVNLAANYGWSWDRILKYYYTGISLPVNY